MQSSSLGVLTVGLGALASKDTAVAARNDLSLVSTHNQVILPPAAELAGRFASGVDMERESGFVGIRKLLDQLVSLNVALPQLSLRLLMHPSPIIGPC